MFATHPRAYAPYFPPPPGSAFKPIMAVMALSEGIVAPRDTLLCNMNALGPENHPVKCLGNHAQVAADMAIIKSCNHYFARLATRLGYEKILGWAMDFGFGVETGFAQVPGLEVSSALFPTEAVGELNLQERGERNLMLLGFGLGAIDDVPPLQVAAAIAAMALGEYRPPSLVEAVNGESVPPVAARSLSLAEAARREVRDAMREVTRSEDGTACPGRAPGLDLSEYDLATKTGTPQVQGGEDHSWFVGYFPSTQPRFAFAIFLEHTGQYGGDVCAPVLQELLHHPWLAEVERSARGAESP